MSKLVQLAVNGTVPIHHDELAEALAKMDSDSFGRLMGTFEEYLESHCGTKASLESQECWIAGSLPENAKRFFKSVTAFIEMDEKKATGGV